jgi:hypothetical protein
MAEADQVEGAVKKPDSVEVHLPPGFFFPAHSVVDDLDGFFLDRCLADPVDDLFKPAVILVGVETQMQNLFGSFQVGQRFFGKGGLDFVEQEFQIVVKDRILEDLHHYPG